MSFREELPSGCPPETAEEITERREFFRLVRYNPPSDSDFQSQRAEKPDGIFHVCECLARGISVSTDLSSLKDQALKLPNLRGRLVCRVTLDAGAGWIQQTGRNPWHHTWWPLSSFDVLSHCAVDTP